MSPARKKKNSATHPPLAALPEVSGNNPCPMLRALAAHGYIDGHRVALSAINDVVANLRGGNAIDKRSAGYASMVIAMFANGLGPSRLLGNVSEGFAPDELRNGPLDKRGVGSGVLDPNGRIDPAQLDRLDEFAVDVINSAGEIERGLGALQLKTMMDANFARAKGRRRIVDRAMMDGEWPILLMVMGKPAASGDYLSVSELRTLFLERRLPDRIVVRLDNRFARG